MRVIAVLTLIYLPATFVSVSPLTPYCVKLSTSAYSLSSQTFFSTDVVHYQGGDDDNGNNSAGITQYSALAMERWAEVTAPLTVLTFVVAAGWYYYWEPMMRNFRAWRRGEDHKDLEKIG